jgi:hypothetical protein
MTVGSYDCYTSVRRCTLHQGQAGRCKGINLQGTKANTDRRHLTTGILSEKCVVRRFRCCADVYLHKPRQYSIAYYTPRLYGIAYCSYAKKPVQNVTLLNTAGNRNTMVF